MNSPFAVHRPLETAYVRRGLFALELMDPVTLKRVSRGVAVTAEGLRGVFAANAGDVLVWRGENDLGRLRKVVIDPRMSPYQRRELAPAELTMPLTRVELQPRADYPFSRGETCLRGRLVQSMTSAAPAGDATVWLQWLDDSNAWVDSPVRCNTAATSGDFVAIVRLARSNVPVVDPDGAMTVRLRATRGTSERGSNAFKIMLGRVAEPSITAPHTYAWEDLEP